FQIDFLLKGYFKWCSFCKNRNCNPAEKDMPFNYRKWNILAFRGRLMSLLAPARGMSTLPAKGGFSRPSSFTHSGVSPRPHLPQDKEGFGSDTSHAEKAVFFFKESRIFYLLGQITIIVYSVFLYSGQFHKRFNLFKIRTTASLIGTEGGDSWVCDYSTHRKHLRE